MTWSPDRMRELLPRAKLAKQARIDELNATIAELQEQIQVHRSRLEATERMIPADFFEMLIASDDALVDAKESKAERVRLLHFRKCSLDDAYLLGRGILPPEIADIKGLYFAGFGGVGAAVIAGALSLALWGASSQLLFIIALILGASLGIAAGFLLFAKNFTIDPSLEYSERWVLANRFSILRRTLSIPKA